MVVCPVLYESLVGSIRGCAQRFPGPPPLDPELSFTMFMRNWIRGGFTERTGDHGSCRAHTAPFDRVGVRMPSTGSARQRSGARATRKVPPAAAPPIEEPWEPWPSDSEMGASLTTGEWLNSGWHAPEPYDVGHGSDVLGRLCRAVEAQDIDPFREVLSEAKVRGTRLERPLALACKHGLQEQLKLLLEAGANPSTEIYAQLLKPPEGTAEDLTEESPLMLALRHALKFGSRGTQCVSLLVQANATLEYEEMIGACSVLCESLCVPSKAPLDLVEDPLDGEPHLVKLIIAARADPELVSEVPYGDELRIMTPLMAACYGRRSICVRHLLDARANPAFALDPPDDVESGNPEPRTALDVAKLTDSGACIMLLEHALTEQSQYTAGGLGFLPTVMPTIHGGIFSSASEYGTQLGSGIGPMARPKPSTLQLLAGVRESPHKLIDAAYHGEVQAVQELLASRADANESMKPDAPHCTALRVASEQGHAEIAMLLIEAGAEVNLSGGPNNETGPLGLACFNGHLDVSTALIEARADVNGRDPDGQLTSFLTPLMQAAYNGHPEIVARLLGAGAKPNLTQSGRLTALDFAESQNHHACAALLEPYRAPDLEALIGFLDTGDIDSLQR